MGDLNGYRNAVSVRSRERQHILNEEGRVGTNIEAARRGTQVHGVRIAVGDQQSSEYPSEWRWECAKERKTRVTVSLRDWQILCNRRPKHRSSL